MYEVENSVRVTVKGPKKEIEMYIHWLKCTEEYRLTSGFNKEIPASKLSLTDFHPLEDGWKFMSTNLKYQIKAFQRRRHRHQTFKYRVNYMVYYDADPLETQDETIEKMEHSNVGILSELRDAFNPIPPSLKQKCPHLTLEVAWKSYYIHSNYRVYSFETDYAIF